VSTAAAEREVVPVAAAETEVVPVPVPVPVVASSGVCAHHVHLSSSHSQSYGDAQHDCHVQDDQLGQQVGNAQHGRHVQDDSHGQVNRSNREMMKDLRLPRIQMR
jgi:hypothetical protein